MPARPGSSRSCAACTRRSTGEALPEPPELEEELGIDAIHQELSRYRYCTVFVIEGDGLDADALEHELEQFGDSLLVVGDSSALKVHVHTDDPGRALSLGVARGVVEGVEIANMHAQTQEREERLLHAVPDADAAACAVVAVAAGDGNRALFESVGAFVVDGGRTMNPSTADLVAAIEACRRREVIVLPNNGNVIMSAEQAADHSSKKVRVVPTRSLQAGLAALVAFDPTLGAEENAAGDERGGRRGRDRRRHDRVARRPAERRRRCARASGSGSRTASRSPAARRFDEVVRAVLERLLAEPRGDPDAAHRRGAAVARERCSPSSPPSIPSSSSTCTQGGQPHYPLLLSAA